MSNYVIIGGNLYHSDELSHHGIKGMKWGRRRFQNNDGSLTPAGRQRYADDVTAKKAAYKQANKEYNKSFSKAYDKSFAAYSPIKKHRQNNDKRWEDAANKAELANKARADYKTAKKNLKDFDKQTKKSQLESKYLEKGMSKEEASQAAERRMKVEKAAKVGAAVAGTALAAYGAYKVNQYVRERNKHIRVGQELVKANEQIFFNLNNSSIAPGATNAQRQVYIDRKNKMTKDILDQAQARGRANARGDSFAKAAKNVLDDELRRRTRR